MDIGPGDWVECVDGSRVSRCPDCDWLPESWPVEGLVYRVVDVGVNLFGESWVELAEFREIDPSGLVVAWDVDRFRPIYRPKESLIQTLLEPVDEMVPA